MVALFNAQCRDWIDFQRTTRGKITSGESGQGKKGRNAEKNNRIARIHAVKKCAGKPRGPERGKQTKTKSDSGKYHSLLQNKLKDLSGLRSKSHADRQLASSLAHRICHHPVNAVVRFFIDREGGVGINDCEAVSREVETLLDVENVVDGPYSLEVSSPGLDRPLYSPADFIRFAGRMAKVRTRELIGGQKVFTGRIDEPTDDGFDILTEGGKVVHIGYDQVEKARLEVEF